ncbi:MAG: acetylxylan esterase [Planctomycetes bacterium]|nr:acetylxylan esterase [Planctomycetota bacterium]
MINRTLSFIACVVILHPVLLAAESASAPATNTWLTEALSAPCVAPDDVLAEVRRFIESRVPRVPQVATAAEWDRIAGQLRRDMLAKVVLRGEAARWAESETRVEWLDTIPGGPGYSIRKLRFEALAGLWIPALLYVPDKLEGRVPANLAVNGHEPKGNAVENKQIRCINLAKRGMITLSVEWLGMGQLKHDGLVHYRANQLDLCGTSAVAPFYLSMKRSLDVLLGLADADPQRVSVSGLSGGGWQTIFISPLDERVTLANPVAGYSGFLTRVHFVSDLGDTEQTPCDMATVADYAHLTAMRAPRPTLLTFNSKDDCCFRADHALQPLLDVTRPIFALYGQEVNLSWHVNDDPGTHNFDQDNRQQFYKMLGDHFYAGQPFDWHEIACQDEVKTAEQLHVPIPDNNENFNSLARKLMAQLPKAPRRAPSRSRRGAVATSDAADASEGSPRDARRAQLREVTHFKKYDVSASRKDETKHDDLQITAWQLKLGSDWTVPATELRPASPAGTTIVIADKGRKQIADEVSRLLDANQRVLAVDPFYFGESTIPQRDALYALLVAGVGERPLGIQAGQVAAIARWAFIENAGKPVTLAAVGPRTSTIALVAAALEPAAIGSVDLHDPLASLKLLIERNETVEHMPELFCYALLEHFDIKDIAALITPRPIRGL